VRRVIRMLALAVWLAPAVAAAGQEPAPTSAPQTAAPSPTAVDVAELPISVHRIEQQLARPSAITLQVTRPMFRLEVVEKRPKWFADIEWLPEADRHLPMPTGTAWQRDFVAMVTPQTAMPFGQSSGLDLLQLMATSLVEGMATNSVIHKIQKAKANRRASAAKAEVDAAIEAWKKERNSASPPPLTSGVPDADVPPPDTPAATPPD